MVAIAQELKRRASELGFVLSGIAPAAAPGRLESFHSWLDAGYAGQMKYMYERRQAYSHPRYVLDGCRSILMLAMPYGSEEPARHGESSPIDWEIAQVARYAQGEVDYHDVIHGRLKRLRAWLLEQCPAALVRGVVDTAPLLERELAAAAGLGWVGKNTLLLNRRWGSYFFLAALLTDLELPADEPDDKNFCGTCTACLDSCPTAAFPSPFVLDARRCISYLTIEHRDPIELELQSQLAGWVFGCDVCQQVCPWNRRVPASSEPEFAPREDLARFHVLEVLELSDEAFRQRFRGTPLWRAKRRGLLRNAILIAGTRRIPQARAALARLCEDEEELLRGAARWAMGQYLAGS